MFGLLGLDGETLTAGWPIVFCAGAESSEWMALALLVSVSIGKVGQICTGHWAQQGDAPPIIALLFSHFLQDMRY